MNSMKSAIWQNSLQTLFTTTLGFVLAVGGGLALGLLVEASPRSLLLGAAAGTVASVVIQGVAYGRRVGIRPV